MRWIKIHDSLLKWEWYGDVNMMALWLHLLLNANYKDKRWQGIIVKRGQLVTGRAKLSKELGISERSVRTCLNRLKTTNEIAIKTTNKYSIITICKYEDYQLNENDTDQQNDQQNANKRPTNDHNSREREYKTLSKEKENIKEKESFVEPEFREAFSMWLEYKKQRRESYKSDLSLKKCYNNLVKLSGNDPRVAMAVVEQSMANNWAGLFALKQDYNGTNRKIDERAERARGYAAVIAQLAKEDEERASGVRGQDNVPW